jgi:hypothetical protein
MRRPDRFNCREKKYRPAARASRVTRLKQPDGAPHIA